jgi:hypothetical protein
MRHLAHVLLVQLIAAIPLFSGDLTITYKIKASALLVISRSGTTVEYHSSHQKRVSNQEEQADTIFDYNNFVKYGIDHKKKVIYKYALEDLIKGLEMIDQAQNETPENFKNFDAKKLFGDISKTSQKKDGVETILNRNCDKWAISMGKFTAKVSVDPNLVSPLPVGGKAAMLDNMTPRSVSTGSGFANSVGKFLEMVSKKGVPLKSNMVMPVGPITAKTSKEALKVVEGPIPSSVFALPSGYAMEDAGKKMLESIKEQIEAMAKKT